MEARRCGRRMAMLVVQGCCLPDPILSIVQIGLVADVRRWGWLGWEMQVANGGLRLCLLRYLLLFTQSFAQEAVPLTPLG